MSAINAGALHGKAGVSCVILVPGGLLSSQAGDNSSLRSTATPLNWELKLQPCWQRPDNFELSQGGKSAVRAVKTRQVDASSETSLEEARAGH